MRKILAVLLLFCLLLPAGLAVAMETPDVTARAAVLLDQETGRILFSKNAHERLPMASTTKIMTAILAIESGRLDEMVTVSEYASLVEGSGVDLDAGEQKTLEELLYGLMLRSGNDAATAIAEHLAGSVEKFARQMTRRAGELGAAQTRFENPHGLEAENHYTTAYDLGIIAVYAMSLPEFREVVATSEKRISWTGRPYDRILYNQNKLLDMYEYADGIKTGWTTPAGRCFVGSSNKDGWGLVSVVLNAPQMWEDTIELMEFGYSYYHWEPLVEEGRHLKTAQVERGTADRVTLVAGNDLGLPLKENEADVLRYEFNVAEPLRAPVSAGDEVGTMEVYFGTQRIAEVPLVAASDVGRRGLFGALRNFFGRLF
ncbi:D-alanyl-D-alanine carboxypeptidase family protein [Dethiobacter alkaliphilus]|uniref:serine-type D-Ala-D-Ala carboxypeptidase n=1 Tax=Dethiobacter alkaliphilus AHT 1 TaxID=555088 RepID=C0GDY6_DETAL|nr:D-alanyl-D-alanine carboxypeptidase family protein [Dethiobacter alkaliphilus]EEG78280.1 Serine-type D-Ala-D-Ala carboxypeptidase [Dethiobacter alkaliphilus AHT 1]